MKPETLLKIPCQQTQMHREDLLTEKGAEKEGRLERLFVLAGHHEVDQKDHCQRQHPYHRDPSSRTRAKGLGFLLERSFFALSLLSF